MSITKALDPQYFNDPEQFGAIVENVFFRTWQYACHDSQIPNPGDYFTFSIYNQDMVIVREDEGTVRALYNVCQHRGHQLLKGSGNTRKLICPYHAWTYELNGQLRGAPNAKAVEGFDTSKICIPSVRLENFLGFWFVNLDNDAANMDEIYPGVRSAMLELCPDIESRQFASEHSIQEGCNWLIAVENYNECYHCKGVHPQFAKGVIDPNSYQVLPFGDGPVLRHSSKPAKTDGAWYDTSGSDYGSFFFWPLTSIQIYPGGLVNTYHWRPLAIDDVRVHRGWFSEDGQVDDTLQTVIDLDRDTTFTEDLSLVRSVQKGLQSRGYTPGPLLIDPNGTIDNETSIAALHQWLKAALN